LIVLCIVVLIQVVGRFVLKIPTPWSEELARYLMIVIVFIGAAISNKEERHLIAINIFEKSPKWMVLVNRVLIHGAILSLSVVFLKASITMIQVAGTETATSMKWLKIAYLYEVVFVGFLLTLFYEGVNFIKTLLGFFKIK
jgi:TRAP-type C4-dicarboxylate transport system permease small subunit